MSTQHDVEQARIAHSIANESGTEGFKSVISAAFAALRALMTVNAGAIIALLAFISSLAGKNVFPSVAPFAAPLTLFGYGLVAALVAMAGVYFAQAAFTNDIQTMQHNFTHPYVHPTKVSKRWELLGRILQIADIAIAAASLCFFISGLLLCRDLILTVKLAG